MAGIDRNTRWLLILLVAALIVVVAAIALLNRIATQSPQSSAPQGLADTVSERPGWLYASARDPLLR